nr:rhodanese domain protein UPF0176 [uncultured bacterium]
MKQDFEIIAFYEFKELASVAPLVELKAAIKELMLETGVRGTVILAEEGFNGMTCGSTDQISMFVECIEKILQSRLFIKSSFHEAAPLRKIDVKIKPEIVTLKKPVDISLGQGTHVAPREWNALINDPDTLVLDTRNDYEFQTGTFEGAVNPDVKKFSDLPEYIDRNFGGDQHRRVAMFCTGGIRCEKFAPYLKGLGFSEVYQLEGGILKYLEEVPAEESLWRGECFVFDERISLGSDLKKGSEPDLSQRHPES